jgi:hypothetical protein
MALAYVTGSVRAIGSTFSSCCRRDGIHGIIFVPAQPMRLPPMDAIVASIWTRPARLFHTTRGFAVDFVKAEPIYQHKRTREEHRRG